MRGRISQTLAIAFLFVAAVSAQQKTAIKITPSSGSLEAGRTLQLSAVDTSGKSVSAQWSSSAPGIATVSSSGLVTAVAGGKATITAKSGPHKAAASISVTSSSTAAPAPAPTQPSVDSSWVHVYPGINIQDLVNQYPGTTTFYLRAGTHRRQQVTPKSGNRFVGEAGAIMDGENVTAYAFETLRSAPSGVTISGLDIKNYTPGSWMGAIQGDNGTNWIVTDNVIHHNFEAGMRPGKSWQVLRNKIHGNRKLGIVGYKSDGTLIQENEVYSNNPYNSLTGGEGGIKVLATQNITIRGNYVHHNYGKGIWSDTNYPTVLIENNRVTDNTDAGIWHEIGYAAVIRNNTVERNGRPGVANDWMGRAGIQVSNSPNVQIYGNTIRDNANGIGIMQSYGYVTTGPYGAYGVQNLYVYNNVIRMAVGRTGLSQIVGDKSYYTSKNNRFENNTYYLGTNSQYFTWDDKNVDEWQWRNYGLDKTSTFVR